MGCWAECSIFLGTSREVIVPDTEWSPTRQPQDDGGYHWRNYLHHPPQRPIADRSALLSAQARSGDDGERLLGRRGSARFAVRTPLVGAHAAEDDDANVIRHGVQSHSHLAVALDPRRQRAYGERLDDRAPSLVLEYLVGAAVAVVRLLRRNVGNVAPGRRSLRV